VATLKSNAIQPTEPPRPAPPVDFPEQRMSDQQRLLVWTEGPDERRPCLRVEDGRYAGHWRLERTHDFGDDGDLFELTSLDNGRLVLLTPAEAPWMAWGTQPTPRCGACGDRWRDPRTGMCWACT
jgi:hypothetical protein